MAFEQLPRLLQSRLKPSRVLPPSSFVGLALPLAALGIVLIGMNLHFAGLVLWAAAMALVGFALERKYAIAVAALVAVSGVLLWRWVIGVAKVYTEAEQLAFALVTLLAWVAGQLGAMVLRQDTELGTDRLTVRWYDDVIRAIFEGSRDCIKLIAADGTVLAINEHGLKMIGASRDNQMIGQHWFDFWDSDQRKVAISIWQTALANGSGEFNGSCRILTGERRTWHNTFTRVQMPGSSEASILCVSRDITAMQRTQQSLKESVAQLNGLLNSISDAFLALDSSWTISFMNRYCEDMFRRNGVEGELGDNFWQLFRDETNPTGLAIRRCMTSREIQHSEHFYEATSTWFSFTIFPTDGGGLGLFVRDVSALKLAEKQIEEEHARLLVAQDIAGYGDWSFDYEMGQMRFSQRAVAMLELGECPPHEYKKRLLERLHPQDRMTLVQAIINSSIESPRIDLVVRIPSDSGEGHFHWIGQLIADANNEPTSMFGAVQDITAHIVVQESQSQARRLMREIIDVLPQRICVIDQHGKYVTTNHLWEQDWIDYHGNQPMPDDFFASHLMSARANFADDISPYLDAVREMMRGERDYFEIKYEAPMPDGSVRHYLAQAVPLLNEGKRLIVFSYSDITSVAKLKNTLFENERSMQALSENLEEIFWCMDTKTGRYTYVSAAYEKIYKVPRQFGADNSNMLFVGMHPDDRKRIDALLSAGFRPDNEQHIFEFRITDADGELHWLSGTFTWLRDENGEATIVAGTSRDITGDKLREQRLYEAAYIDDLTELPNRKGLMHELQRHIEASDDNAFALLLLNVDRFKTINETLGHSTGDELLRAIAQRLRRGVDPNIHCARIGGNEFSVLCAADRYQSIADTVLQCFDAPFRVADEQLYLTASIGIALWPEHSRAADELLKFAGVAQQRAKATVRHTAQLFQSDMMLPSRERLALENELRGALARDEFELFYQGKFHLDSGAMIGAEVLLRWHSSSRGMVMPGEFIPLLEETGMILPVGEWVLHSACRQLQQWHGRNSQWFSLAVNVSPLQLANRQFAQTAASILQQYAIPRDVIELEITESALMADLVHGAHTIETLKKAGFKIALDDFGTGYSSLGYLRKFAPDTLKIDRSFVADLAVVENDIEIVAGILQLASALNIDVVAEGIEQATQRDLLVDLGCEYGQGYLFGKPMRLEQFEVSLIEIAATSGQYPRVHGDLH